MERWDEKDDEMIAEIIDSVECVECEWSCDLSEQKEWLQNLKNRFSNGTE